MKLQNLFPLRTVLALAAAATLAACASAPQSNPGLDRAQAAYDAAARDAQVARSAPVELQKAQLALQRAQSALKAGDDAAVVEHYAYLASQRTEVALQAGKIAAADAAVARSQADRDRILIDARTNEANAQRIQADQARIAADKSRAEAEQSRKLAEQRLATATTAQQRNSALEAEMAALKAKPTERGMVLTLGDVLFDSGKSSLKAGAMRTVDQLADFLRKNAERKVLIEGYTDSVGGEAYNRGLSMERAEAVRQALQTRQVSADRITTAGLGESYPVADNGSAAGRQQNRRIEVIFSDETGAIKPRS